MKRLARQIIFYSVCFYSLAVAPFGFSETKPEPKIFTMGFWYEPEDDVALNFAYLFYKELFSRIGYGFEVKVIPAARVGYMVERGELDGEPGRLLGYQEKFPTLVRIEKPVLEISIAAYTVDPKIQIDGWDALRSTTLRVDYFLGSNIVERELPKVVPPDRLSSSNDIADGLTKLYTGRSDLFIHTALLVDQLLLDPKFSNKNIRVAGVMYRDYVYPFISPQKAHLKSAIETELITMHRDGTTQKLLDQTINKTLTSRSLVTVPPLSEFDEQSNQILEAF